MFDVGIWVDHGINAEEGFCVLGIGEGEDVGI
jgi:hypothetical protein